jgi:hypothetical protein
MGKEKKQQPLAKAVKKLRKDALLKTGMITDKPQTNRIINSDVKSFVDLKYKYANTGTSIRSLYGKQAKPIFDANYLVCGCKADVYVGEDFCNECYTSIVEHKKAISKNKLKASSPISNHLVTDVTVQCYEYNWCQMDLNIVANQLAEYAKIGIPKLVKKLIVNEDGFSFNKDYKPYVEANDLQKLSVASYIFGKQIEFFLNHKKYGSCFFTEKS